MDLNHQAELLTEPESTLLVRFTALLDRPVKRTVKQRRLPAQRCWGGNAGRWGG